jgi:hypothetical protein
MLIITNQDHQPMMTTPQNHQASVTVALQVLPQQAAWHGRSAEGSSARWSQSAGLDHLLATLHAEQKKHSALRVV